MQDQLVRWWAHITWDMGERSRLKGRPWVPEYPYFSFALSNPTSRRTLNLDEFKSNDMDSSRTSPDLFIYGGKWANISIREISARLRRP